MKRSVIVFGLISGLIVTVFMVTSMAWYYNSPKAEGNYYVGYGSMILAFAFIFVAIKSYRDNHNNGVISFGKGFQIGLLISLIASTMYVAAWSIEYHFFMPDFLDKTTAYAIKTAHENNESAKALAEKIEGLNSAKRLYDNNALFVLVTYAEILPVGLIISLIAALILKRKVAQGVAVPA